ncbi:hypothetical protein ACCO45_006980 [Purpureocillium lilacinum]|uniref:Uncharacterized protein n=1 Tax=Purpureocillium lilacinum TaxID=33203 RepID=A0ACC4DS25_PURLI
MNAAYYVKAEDGPGESLTTTTSRARAPLSSSSSQALACLAQYSTRNKKRQKDKEPPTNGTGCKLEPAANSLDGASSVVVRRRHGAIVGRSDRAGADGAVEQLR